MIPRRRKLKVEYKKMSGRYWGEADAAAYDGGQSPIYIDPRAKGKKLLELILHESTHVLFPELDEEDVVRVGVILANTLWHEGYRKIDNDTSEPLQDGKA